MAPAAVWSVERGLETASASDGLRLLAVYSVLAANFALLFFPAAVAALVLLGSIR